MSDKNFVAYEYKTKTVKSKAQSRTVDLYEAFGWEVTEVSPALVDSVTISLKRDRKITHKNELNKLERKAEQLEESITALEKNKTKTPSVFAYIFGVVSALVLGGGMSLVMVGGDSVAYMIVGVILGCIGIVLCGINYPIFKKWAAKKTEIMIPQIESGEESLADVLEQGNDLLARAQI